MSYQVLARKWRPKLFSELIGQPHVTKVLTHALGTMRVHHAYLFTGTRGVGKTSLARIFAKCLNCEEGVTPQPCGVCPTCQEIDQGRFPDLLEIDAASRTRVEETRELLENVPYLPTKGRFKIYLIDEVHMLSTSSFNALLKTLEEPPAHIKFILATTDPQRLPVTVLSRCLRFNLRPITQDEIFQKLQCILKEEKIKSEDPALVLIARAAKGSMRDALSLLEQAIGLGAGKVEMGTVKEMLGRSHETLNYNLVEKLLQCDARGIYRTIQEMAQNGADFESNLEQLLLILHALNVVCMIPECRDEVLLDIEIPEALLEMAKEHPPEALQLFYQIGINGRKDFMLSPEPRMGFEMLLLRMLAFLPSQAVSCESPPQERIQKQKSALAHKIEKTTNNEVALQAPPLPSYDDTKIKVLSKEHPNWGDIVWALPLTGLSQVLVKHCVVKSWSENEIKLLLDKSQAVCLNATREAQIATALNAYLGKSYKLSIEVDAKTQDTPMRQSEKVLQDKQKEAVAKIEKIPAIKNMLDTFGATIENVTILEDSQSS
ncbi:MAG TPA: DNA polymerase III subunit gamma/tau [Gammaproteobacteria bacterium]|nr:DNA polymerase III subunit gamma/tau [Gammaproteobacteria bacterium]